MNNTIPDNLVEKIRKLLALGTSDNANEAELAMQRAKALAIQHDIDLASIQVFENKKSEAPIVKSEALNLGQRKAVCQKFISWILQDYFKVKIIYHGCRAHGYILIFVGRTTDIQIATYIQGFLKQEFMRLWHNYREQNPTVQTKDRNSFFYGLYKGLDAKLSEQEKQTEKEVFVGMRFTEGTEKTEQIQSCYALAKVNFKEELDKKLSEFYPKLGKAAPHARLNNNNESARQAGFKQGQNINLRMGLAQGNGGQLGN